MQTTEITAGITPMRTSLKDMRASSTATTMSEAPTSPRPPANAAPLTAAITGLSLSMMVVNTWGYGTDLRPSMAAPGGLLRSAPEQNAGSAPVMTIQRTAGSSLAASRCSYSSLTSTDESALRFSGRFSVIQAAPFRIS